MQAFRWVLSPPASLISFFTYLNKVALTNSCYLRHDCDAYSGWKGKRSGYEQCFTASLLLLVWLLIVGLIVCQLLEGVAWVYCNLLRDSLVSWLEKSCFQLKGFSQIRLGRVCLIRWLSGFQVTTVVPDVFGFLKDSSKEMQVHLLGSFMCIESIYELRCKETQTILLFIHFIHQIFCQAHATGKCLTGSDRCVRFPSSPPAPSPLPGQKCGVCFV